MADTPGTNKLTVLVFKDNFTARTFEVPLRWITRFGFLSLVLFSLTAGSVVLLVKYYRMADQGDPARIQDLQMELTDLRQAYKALETEAMDAKAKVSGEPPAPVIPAPVIESAQPPVNPVAVTAPPQSGALFTLLPSAVLPPPTDPASIPIRIDPPKIQWVGKKVRVSFAIQYIRTDGGAQQGRIVILARGPDSVWAYPEGVINPAGSSALLSNEKGEYFSVGRYREVRAEFGPFQTNQAIKGVDVLIFGHGNLLLFNQNYPVEAAPAAVARPKPAPPAEAPASSTTSPPTSPMETAPAPPAPEVTQ